MNIQSSFDALAIAKEFQANNMAQIACLDKMPLPVAIFYVGDAQLNELDDFIIIYGNQALAELGNMAEDKIIGSKYYENIFPLNDKANAHLYWETAINGIINRFDDSCAGGKQYFHIMSYQPMKGYCACIIEDISEKMRLSKELEDARHCIDLALENTLDYMCFYDVDDNSLCGEQNTLLRLPHMPSCFHNVPQALADRGVLHPSSLPQAEEMFRNLAKGDEGASAELELNLAENSVNYRWYKMTSVTYKSPVKNEKRILILVRNIHDEVMYRKTMQKEALIDPLTQLYNRRAAEKLIEKTDDDGRIKAFFLFDLDNFKGINDTYGHQAGDDVLCYFGRVLKNAFREMDIVFRLGGDEFAAFATGKDKSFVDQIAKRILEIINTQSELPFPIKTSIGICLAVSGTCSYEKFYEIADSALYEAKKAGKNIWRVKELESQE